MPNRSVGIRKTHVPRFDVKKVLFTAAYDCCRSRRLFEFVYGDLLKLLVALKNCRTYAIPMEWRLVDT
jgi:hypothetical protein